MLAAFQPVGHRLRQPGGDPAAAFRLFFGEVDGVDAGHGRPAIAGGQHQPFIHPGIGHVERFQRGRGAGQHHRQPFEPRAHHRHIARIVAHAFVLFEADLVCFIHHDQPKRGIGQEQCGARTDHHLRLPASNRPPCPAAFGGFERGMPQHRGGAETVFEPAQERFGQRDFGQQHQHLPVRAQRLRHRFKIGFGFARSGYPVEQERREFARRHCIHQLCGNLVLIRAQHRLGKIGAGAGVGAVAVHQHRFQHALVHQRTQHRIAHSGDGGEFADGRLFALQRGHCLFALLGHAFGQPAAEPVFGDRRRTAQRARAGNHHSRHRCE